VGVVHGPRNHGPHPRPAARPRPGLRRQLEPATLSITVNLSTCSHARHAKVEHDHKAEMSRNTREWPSLADDRPSGAAQPTFVPMNTTTETQGVVKLGAARGVEGSPNGTAYGACCMSPWRASNATSTRGVKFFFFWRWWRQHTVAGCMRTPQQPATTKRYGRESSPNLRVCSPAAAVWRVPPQGNWGEQ
jgi:hypothetical protein